MKKLLIMLTLLIISLSLFAGGDDVVNQSDSVLPPINVAGSVFY